MSGFPPSKKSASKDATRPETKAVKPFSKGSGGIPAALKMKNSGSKPAAFPLRVANMAAGDDKTQSVF